MIVRLRPLNEPHDLIRVYAEPMAKGERGWYGRATCNCGTKCEFSASVTESVMSEAVEAHDRHRRVVTV